MPPPLGSDLIAAWAARRGLAFTPRPDEDWFRRWEPYDTIAPPSAYRSACTWMTSPGHAVIAEPWYADGEAEPLERTLLGFAAHPALRHRAAMRVGEFFLTRVAFIESPPPPKVTLGDALWDAHVTTFAASPREAAAAFRPRLRKLLATRGFQGHLELRPGGLVVHCAGLRPVPEHYERLLGVVREIVNAAIV
ncbi:hypothetical protein [Sorangium sp. So ce131]|uniref:hypothetical protein n=1 Tax=Sorangium sp. So ce131 TaxID=3133282 RepID=UPI003F5D68E1